MAGDLRSCQLFSRFANSQRSMKLRSRSSVNWRAAVAGDRVDEEKKPVIIIAFPFFSSSAPIVHVQFWLLSRSSSQHVLLPKRGRKHLESLRGPCVLLRPLLRRQARRRICMCVCVCMYVRTCVRACVHTCVRRCVRTWRQESRAP